MLTKETDEELVLEAHITIIFRKHNKNNCRIICTK